MYLTRLKDPWQQEDDWKDEVICPYDYSSAGSDTLPLTNNNNTDLVCHLDAGSFNGIIYNYTAVANKTINNNFVSSITGSVNETYIQNINTIQNSLNETKAYISLGQINMISVTINGDLVTTNLVAQENKTVTDTLIKLGQGLTESPSKDQGIVFTRGGGGSTNVSNKSLVWDESNDTFAFAATDTEDGSTNGNIEISSSKFHLDSGGNVTMAGAVTATTGTIGGFTIGTDLTSTAGTLILKGSSGQITGSDVLFNGGKVGGWTIGATTLTGGVVTLNSAGSIEVGGLGDATTTATTNSGFFADSSGNVLIKGNVSGNDYLKISAGGGIDIKSQTFDLATSTMILDSGTNSGKIQLGASGGPTSNATGQGKKGIYFDGTGDMLVSNGGSGTAVSNTARIPNLLMIN